MFTAVMMVALTTTDAMPAWGRRGCGCGCWGGCYGCSCWGGCYGCWGCYGCGCYGGCYGGGCWGGCYGCCGGVVVSGCCASAGGQGGQGGQGGVQGGGQGGQGAGGAMRGGGYRGGRRGPGMRGGTRGGTRGGARGGAGGRSGGGRSGGGRRAPEEVRAPAPATLVVQLPADAKLTINDKSTVSTSGRRVFASPPIQRGKDFYYELKATVVRNNEPVTTQKRVRIRAGETTRVRLSFPSTSLVSR